LHILNFLPGTVLRSIADRSSYLVNTAMNSFHPEIRVTLGWVSKTILLLFLTILSASAQKDPILNRARQALDRDETAQAIALLENYRKAHAANSEVFNLLGIAYGRAGDDAKSLAMFKEFARLAPNLPGAYNNLGAAYLRQQDSEHAEASFRHALRLSPQDVSALYNLGALLNARHKYPESRPLLDRAFRREQSSAIGYEAAVAAAGLGDRKAALHILNSLEPPRDQSVVPWLKLVGTLNFDEGNLADSSKALESAVKLAPGDKEVLYTLALVRLKSNQADLAIPLLDQVFSSLAPGERSTREGVLLTSYGGYQQALAKFQDAIAADPGSYEAHYNLAVLRLEHLKDIDGALDAAQHALAIRNTGDLQDLLGDINESQNNFKDALNHYQEAVRIDPGSDKFAFDLGAELLLHENFDAAETVFQAAQKRFPKASKIYLGLGTAEFMRGKTADSVASYLKGVDLDPQFEPGYLFLGEAFSFADTRSMEVVAKLAYLAGKQPQTFGAQYYYGAALVKELNQGGDAKNVSLARAALQRAAVLRPSDARVQYQLGELCRVQKQTAEAISYYQKAVALDPQFSEPLYKMGQAYVRLGKPDDAKKAFAQHREVMTKAEADVYHRASEIQSFVLTMRTPQ
jgi:tetratricopeptide (TPR) repeat protein